MSNGTYHIRQYIGGELDGKTAVATSRKEPRKRVNHQLWTGQHFCSHQVYVREFAQAELTPRNGETIKYFFNPEITAPLPFSGPIGSGGTHPCKGYPIRKSWNG